MTTIPSPIGLEFNIDDLYEEAKKRWLRPVEVLYILQNHHSINFTNHPPQLPTSGSLFLFNRRVLRFFRKDGYNWRKKKDGRTVGEAHERLKVGNVEILNCYYAHGEENRTFHRRSYWMLDPAYEHIVLVHYRETSEEKSSSGPVMQLTTGSSPVFRQSQSSYTSQNLGRTSMIVDSCEPNQNFSSPGSVEVSSDVFIRSNGMDNLGGTDAQALRQLEKQLSLNENRFGEISPFYSEHEIAHDLNPQQVQGMIYKQDQSTAFSGPDDREQPYDGYNGKQDGSDKYYHELLDHDSPDGNEKAPSWMELLESYNSSSQMKLPEQHAYVASNENSLSSLGRVLITNQENGHCLSSNSNSAENSAFSFPQEDGGVKFPTYSLGETQGANSDYCPTYFGQIQIQEPLGADSSFTVSQKRKFTIKAVSPEWCYAMDTPKVIIIGSFLCLPDDSSWACMFGDIEVHAEIIQDGVISCEAPSHLPGKVTLCITSGNRESCSEVSEFEFRDKTNSCSRCNSLEKEVSRSPENLLLLVRFAQMLLSASTLNNYNIESGSLLPTKQKTDDDSWSHIIESLLVGSGTSSGIVDWLLEELLKDRLQLWLSCRSKERDEGTGCSLSKREQGILHMVSGLGYEWALNPILSCGMNINFRDINGWTALHWAARFGREKMVASLIASGAFAGALTDPTSEDPTGKTAASIAASIGYNGLAGYLSEVDLRSHLSSLTLEESGIYKRSAELEPELTVIGVSNETLATSEDQVSLKDTLAAARNATQAAARIQAAFRAHSFRKRREREAAAAAAAFDGYDIAECSIDNIPVLYNVSKLSFQNSSHYNSAALSIQKKYRGWKGRKDFLTLRQKVVKIQAHVRGYQVRKHYTLIIWAVGILDKVVLRWRRKGTGLGGFRQDIESIDGSDDEDFLKVFRKQNVHVAIEMAVSRVLSMVHSTKARQQYHRMLEMYRQAKVELASTSEEALLSTSSEDAFNTEDDSLDQVPSLTLYPSQL
ncbi:hypothetical protein TanjilG_16797 [Lupinus angustifolius]|uniref:CG-1 domain-containing protein n=1 Tax=Lupinus angustifolius TaxID=3871 RepID=A0A4P1QZZ6_LUPAN|nr:PREDICTED: calmodulin-binding transcription activator 4-like isoform X2 [Lupinus angustifolius]OIV98470.1 hypothetical protein TanjilG_16797 [Lupinus angustifolius]